MTGKRKPRSSIIEIFAANLVTLYCGCKTGFLYDLPERLTTDTALSITAELKTSFASFSDLSVLEYNMDVIFLRHRLLASHLETHRYPYIVDIDADQPRLDNTGTLGTKEKSLLLGLCAKLERNANDIDEVIRIAADQDLSGSAMFGLLLGFPVIYFSTKECHCLNYRSLEVLRLSVNPGHKTSKLFTVSSFSVPKQVLDDHEDLLVHLNKWKDSVTHQTTCATLSFTVTSAEETHSALIL